MGNIKFVCCLLICLLPSLLLAAPHTCGGAVPSSPPELEIFTIHLELQPDGKIEIIEPDGSVKTIGKVKAVPGRVKFPAFTAAKWGRRSTVTAAAVNAVHLLVDVIGDRGLIYSILPSSGEANDVIPSGADYAASIVTDLPPGTGLFGHYAPPVHSLCFVQRLDRQLSLHEAQRLRNGDKLIIIARAKPCYREIEIDNFLDGTVNAIDSDGARTLIGRVVRPATGTGRFHGSEYAYPGRIRANHPGVICVSTSPYGEVGGFQIIPLEHAGSPEMQQAWQLTQWLIIAPAGKNDSGPGSFPLFGGIIGPFYAPEDFTSPDRRQRLLRRTVVLADYGNGSWQPLPVVSGRNDTALAGIRRFLIRLPVF